MIVLATIGQTVKPPLAEPSEPRVVACRSSGLSKVIGRVASILFYREASISSASPATGREKGATMNVVIRLQASSLQTTVALKTLEPGLRRYPLALLLCAVAALVPYILSSAVMTSIPRAAIVLWYAVIALVAGLSGIMWILRTALLTLGARHETDIPLHGETQQRVLEALSLPSSR